MNILIKGKHENFVIPFKSHERDFCYDCVAVSKKHIDDNRIQYGLGFSLEIDPEDPMPGGVLHQQAAERRTEQRPDLTG